MKYEFIREDEDTTKLKYKDKEFEIKRNVKLVSEMQEIIKKSRLKMIMDLAKDGISIDTLTIEKKENGKTYYDNSNRLAIEKIYQEQATLEYFNDLILRLFNMSLEELLMDIGLTTEKEGEEFSKQLMECLNGTIPRK
jgi:hypothetical protein